MIQLIGAILICGGATMMGLRASARITTRCKALSGFSRAIMTMQAEIKCRLTPLSEILEGLSKHTEEPVRRFFSTCLREHKKHNEIPFSVVWKNCVACAGYLELTNEERKLLADAGSALGRFDSEEQARGLELMRSELEAAHQKAEEERARLGKLYRSLGVTCGLALAILFL